MDMNGYTSRDPQWAVPSRILCGVAAVGQCPGAPTMQTTGGARARRVGGMSGPDIGARRATARARGLLHAPVRCLAAF